MKTILSMAAVAAAALGLAACDKPAGTKSAYINSGQSATPAMPATSTPSQPATVPSTEPLGQPAQPDSSAPQPQSTTSTATSDTASPNAAPPAK